jgi:hypothetical protein
VETTAQDIEPLRGEIAALQEEVAALRANQAEGGAGGGDGASTAQLEKALNEAVSASEAAQSASRQAADNSAAIEELSASVSEIENSISGGGAGETAALETLTTRLDGVEDDMAALKGTVSGVQEAQNAPANDGSGSGGGDGSSGSGEQTSQLAGDFKALSGTVEGLTGEVSTMSETVSSLSDSVTSLEEGQASLSEDVAGLSETAAALEERVVSNEETLSESGAGNTVAKAIAAAGLKSAMDRGTPFMTELEAFASVGGDEEAISSLRDYAADGVPTLTQLIERFGPVANDIVATGQGLDENASVTDRLMSSARSLVQVRPVGNVEGEGPGAIAARIEARLKDGDLAGAIEQWETLPDAAKDVSQDFIAQVRARQTADQLVGSVLTDAMSATQPDNGG